MSGCDFLGLGVGSLGFLWLFLPRVEVWAGVSEGLNFFLDLCATLSGGMVPGVGVICFCARSNS